MNRSLISLLSLGLLSSAAAISCGSDDKKDPYANAEDFCAAWSERACVTKVVANCSQEDADKGACRRAQKRFCMDLLGDRSYHRAPVEECLEFVEKAYSDATIDADEAAVVRRLGPPCAQVVGEGGDLCDSDKDCGNNGVCEDTPSGVGVCRIAGGELCEPGDDLKCASNYYCSGDGYCVRRGSTDSCETDDECDSEQLCVVTEIEADPEADPPVEASTSGECETKLAPGDECDEDRQCMSGWCEENECTNKVVLGPQVSVCESLR